MASCLPRQSKRQTTARANSTLPSAAKVTNARTAKILTHHSIEQANSQIAFRAQSQVNGKVNGKQYTRANSTLPSAAKSPTTKYSGKIFHLSKSADCRQSQNVPLRFNVNQWLLYQDFSHCVMITDTGQHRQISYRDCYGLYSTPNSWARG